MPVVPLVQNSFVAGELGPYMAGRSDTQLYPSGAAVLENFLLLPQGGLTRRGGFEYVATTEDGARLRKFDFNNEQQYLFVFTDSELKIYYDKGLASTIATPWDASDLSELRFTQNAEVLFVLHEDYAPRVVRRQGSHTSWAIATWAFQVTPYYRYNTEQTATPSATTGSINVTLSPTTSYFDSNWVGTNLRINGGTCTIDSISNGYTVACTVDINLNNTNADPGWEEEAWSAAHGWPRCGTFHQNRLWFLGTGDAPNSFFGSDVNGFDSFDDSDGSLDDTACVFTLVSDKVHTITDAYSLRNLNIFTTDGEFVATGGGVDAPITPSNISVQPQSEYGNNGEQVQNVDGELYFVDRSGKQVMSQLYDLETDRFRASKKSTVAHHLFTDGNRATRLAYLAGYKDTQGNFLFVVREDGELAVLTVDEERQIIGWSRFATGETLVGPTNGFQDVAVVSTDHGDGIVKDTLYAVIKRDTGTFIEALTEEEVYMDHWYIGSDATAKATWTGLTTLASETIQVVGDGLVAGLEIEVDGGGTFTADFPVNEILAGLQYTSTMTTMDLAFSIDGQIRRGQSIRKIRALVDLYDSLSLSIDGYPIRFRSFGPDLLDDPLTPYTGTEEIRLKGISDDQNVTCTVEEPLRCTLLTLTTEVKTKI